MNLESDDLLAQVHKDWPVELELSTLRLLSELQDQRIATLEAENESLKAQLTSPGGYSPTVVRPYVGTAQIADGEDGGRHGG